MSKHVLCGLVAGLCALAACDEAQPQRTFTIVSGSENEGLEPIITAFAEEKGITIDIDYLGSVDIARCLQAETGCAYDAVWPANQLWIALGDRNNTVAHTASIMRSPVVLGLNCSIANRLGWISDTDVTMADIIAAADQGAFTLTMTSATQSNSGASAYIGALYALSGSPDVLTLEQLEDRQVQADLKRFLATVDRSAGSSGWLRTLVVENPHRFDAMFNYESMIIEANLGWNEKGKFVPGLINRGHEPLCAVYPRDAIMVSDSPLGYVDHGIEAKETLFLELQAHLLTPETQDAIKATGRRTGLIGLNAGTVDPTVFNPDWGIDTKRIIASVPVPTQEVIETALNLYQTGLRKPSLTAWVLDASSSMSGRGIEGLKKAMENLLDPETAAANLLQLGPNDVTIVVTFAGSVQDVWVVEGNEPTKVARLLNNTQAIDLGSATALYEGLAQAVREIAPYAASGRLDNYLVAINAMTDGETNAGMKAQDFERFLSGYSFMSDVPINAIAFGGADTTELQQLTTLTVGRYFDSKGDLPATLRSVKGYN